jgi:hypothetical protein
VHNGIGGSNVSQELVSVPFPFGSASDEPGNVDKFQRHRQHALRMHNIIDGGYARVGHRDHTRIGFNGTEGLIFGGDAGGRKGVEDGTFAHVG